MSERVTRAAAAALPAAIGLGVAMAAASALILAYGQAPLAVYKQFLDGTWGNAYGIGQVLFKATPLLFTGLAVAVPLRAGLFNVGAEGQVALGAFAMGVVGASLPTGASPLLAVPACLAAGFLAGAAAGAVPGALKAWRGSHEVIVTIMLNFVILAKLSDWGKPLYLRESVHTAPIVGGAALRRASDFLPSLRGSALSTAALVAAATALGVWALMERTTVGFRLRAVGQGVEAARAAGIRVGAHLVLAMALSGGLAGLVGSSAVLGYKRYYEEGFSGGVGFMGIAVALLGRNHPLGIAAAALLFGTLSQGGLVINAAVPKEIVEVLQGVIILAVAASSGEVRRIVAGVFSTGNGADGSSSALGSGSRIESDPEPRPQPGPSEIR